MSKSKHTSEPWKYDDTDIIDAAPNMIATTDISHSDLSVGECKANARRIVACINACAGVPIDVLESGAYVSPKILQFQVSVLKKQRDELLAALNEIANWLVCGGIASAEDMAQSFPTMLQITESAIARVKGESND